MNLIQRLQCSLSQKGEVEAYYRTLSTAQLKKRKAYHLQLFWILNLSWATALALTVWAANLSLPLLILYAGTVAGIFITQWVEYRRKIKMIDDVLSTR